MTSQTDFLIGFGHPSLSISEMAHGMIACRSNARALLEEADALLPRRHYARACFLVVAACEELGKFFVLELGAKRVAQGSPPSWKRFWQRFRSHDSKLMRLYVQLGYVLLEEDATDQGIVEAAEALFDESLAVRNSALYVDIGPDGSFRKPADVDVSVPLPVFRAAATLALHAADRRGRAIEEVEAGLQKRHERSAEHTSLKCLVKAVQRARDTGLDEREVAEIVSRSLNG